MAGGHASACVAVPTTPNPTTGSMMVVPQHKVRRISTTVEEAFKLIVSVGSVLARVSRPGLDVETLLMDTREWRRRNAPPKRPTEDVEGSV